MVKGSFSSHVKFIDGKVKTWIHHNVIEGERCFPIES